MTVGTLMNTTPVTVPPESSFQWRSATFICSFDTCKAHSLFPRGGPLWPPPGSSSGFRAVRLPSNLGDMTQFATPRIL